MTATLEHREQAREYMRLVREKPANYCRKILGIDLWQKQSEIMQALADPSVPFISVRSGNGVGKTHLAAASVFQYLDSHAPGYAIISSSSWRQTQKGIWPLIRTMHRKALVPLGGGMLATEWKRGDLWGAFCVSPDEPENFSGFRTKHGVLVVVDEASALEREVFDAILGLCSTRGSKLLLIGNPLVPEGPFFDTFQNPEWLNFSISTLDVVNLGIPGLATQEWVDGMAKQWGVTSPMYQARVLGEFPASSSYALISLGWLPARIVADVMPAQGERRMGVDVARYGDDRTVILIRDDRCVLHMEAHTKEGTMETVGRVKMAAQKWRVADENISIDDTGLGGGVTDRLEELGLSVNPVNNGEQASDRDRFKNVRAETYWRIRDRISPDARFPLFVPREFSAVLKECTWPHYHPTSDGKIALESKDSIKARRGMSPDLSDALALTFANDDTFSRFNAA
jgi:hypothetical protein